MIVAGKSTTRVEPDSTESPCGDWIVHVNMLPRKSAKHIIESPVPQTDTGSWVEHTKALERITVKELGKIAP